MILMDERQEQNISIPKDPIPKAPVPNAPVPNVPATPPCWHDKKRFLHTHKRLFMGLAIGFLIGLFMGGTMSMAAVRRISRVSVMSRPTSPMFPRSGERTREEFAFPPVESYYSERFELKPDRGHNESYYYESDDDSYLRGYKEGYKDGFRER
jgi:hypothetical protein